MNSPVINVSHSEVGVKKIKHCVSSIKRNKLYYFLIIPGLLYFIIFHYGPMFGIIIAFKDVVPFEGVRGIIDGPWVGFKHFINFFNSYYFWNVLSNTIIISVYRIIFGFPAPIILALLLNEIRSKTFKRTVQTISYLPHFISMVVLAGLITTILSTNGGIINEIIKKMGKEPIFFLGDNKYFRTILITSSIWQGIGWGSIIYLAAISGIDPQLYEASIVDGANKWRQTWHITIPGMSNVIVIMFIFAVGSLLNAGFEQILLLYSPAVYEVSDIIDTYVYREGLISLRYSFASAVGLFKSAIAMILLIGTNYLAKKFEQSGIW
jgi:putative aldouronate transport system permease protein